MDPRSDGKGAMERAWKLWKKGFDAWEVTTAQYLDQVLRNPTLLGPAGRLVDATARAKGKSDRLLGRWWDSVGLPSRQDHDRALHTLNRLESKLLDLEERLAELEDGRAHN